MYDSMRDILVRLLRRFMKGQAVEKRYGSDLTSIECQDVKLQLPDRSIVIGKGAREALVKLKSVGNSFLYVHYSYKTAAEIAS